MSTTNTAAAGEASSFASLAIGQAIIAILVSIGTGCYIFQTFQSWYRLRHFKGPPIASLTRFWLARHVWGGRMHLDFHDVNQKYGSLARVGPNDLVTSDPAVMRRMLAVRSPYRRSEWYIGVRFDPVQDNIASIRDEERHTELRAIMAPGYAGKDNDDLEGTVDRNIQHLVHLIRSKYTSTDTQAKPMDFGRKVQYFTLDIISDLAYREPFGYLATDSDLYDYIAEVEKVFASALMVTIFPWLNWVLRLSILKAAMPSEKDPLGLGKILGITKKVVAKRFGPDKKVQQDMLGSFIAHGLNREEAESETILQIMAGSDTTATAIRATFLYLVMHPRVVSKLRAEIESSAISSPITDAEARKMPYLQAVIKEGLRIFPPVVGLMSKEVPAGGDVINDRFVPGGTKIGYGAYGIFRNVAMWGDDADAFRPERWLDDTAPDRTREMEATLELIFSYGKYQCLGKNLAMMELNKVFVELLRNFDFQIVNPLQPIRSVCHGIFFQSEMWLTAFERVQ
ncbi:cytochrome P450 [Phlyctema vagabunda]|uniref:Cytochrome P450 n=1 Tax=Phlyctema vagabunda TaxID=108571 RepID=A0ABR4PSR5_9HELO